jgi:transcriptional regulator with XRE-family HTH domain
MKRLAEERVRRGYTQQYVANRMGTNQSQIARLESTLRDPRLSTVLRYAAIVAGAVFLAKLLREADLKGRS